MVVALELCVYSLGDSNEEIAEAARISSYSSMEPV